VISANSISRFSTARLNPILYTAMKTKPARTLA
jgi:hypothetical protein